jgi:hypothetical protein
VLDYPLEEVHEEAERLEHFISERFEERIAAKLGNPTVDPHGHSIPAMDGEMAKEISAPLTQAMGEGTFEVDSISDRDAATVKLRRTSGIASGVLLRLRQRNANDDYQVPLLGRGHQTHVAVGGDAPVVENHLHGGILPVDEDGMVPAVVEKHAETLRVEVVLVGHLHLNLSAASRQRNKKKENEGGETIRSCE